MPPFFENLATVKSSHHESQFAQTPGPYPLPDATTIHFSQWNVQKEKVYIFKIVIVSGWTVIEIGHDVTCVKQKDDVNCPDFCLFLSINLIYRKLRLKLQSWCVCLVNAAVKSITECLFNVYASAWILSWKFCVTIARVCVWFLSFKVSVTPVVENFHDYCQRQYAWLLT